MDALAGLELLELANYKYNRAKYPQFEPKEYRLLFENWEEYEKIYQNEKNDEDS